MLFVLVSVYVETGANSGGAFCEETGLGYRLIIFDNGAWCYCGIWGEKNLLCFNAQGNE